MVKLTSFANITLTLVLSFFVAVPALAVNCFRNGTEWELEGCYPPDQEWTSYLYLEEDITIEGYVCHKMMFRHDEESDPQFKAYIRSYEDKVYFTNSIENPEWRLAYDFSLLPGDEALIYNIDSTTPECCLLRCTHVEKEGDWEYMTLERADENPSLNLPFQWIKYLGSGSVLRSFPDDSVGNAGYSILKVTYDNSVIYQSPTANVTGIEEEGIKIGGSGLICNVDGLNTGDHITITDGKGVRIFQGTTDNSSLDIALPATGIYIVIINERSYRIIK